MRTLGIFRFKAALAIAFVAPQLVAQVPSAELNPEFQSDLLRYVEDNLPIQNPKQNQFEAQCYEHLLLHAKHYPDELLSRSSSRHVNFAHLFGDDRARYRGKLIHIEGRLRLLRQYDSPDTLKRADQGLEHLFEGWVFADDFGNNPYCVVFSELPSGWIPAESIDRRVEVDAFFFKRYRYEAKDGWRDAPLLIAKTIRATGPPAASASNIWNVPLGALVGVFILIGLTAAAAGSTIWWFRRADRQVRERLAKVRNDVNADRFQFETAPAETE
jgi:hypothetical protein